VFANWFPSLYLVLGFVLVVDERDMVQGWRAYMLYQFDARSSCSMRGMAPHHDFGYVRAERGDKYVS
jgi:hypothetical protein